MGHSNARLIARHVWAPGLATLRFETVHEPFHAGQFFNISQEIEGVSVKRPYSASSAPGQPLEFFVARVEGGALTPALFELELGEEVSIDPKPAGFFTLDYVPPARDLWLISTGTGLGPFVSMLRTAASWGRFERFVVVHGVREAAHLAYADELDQLASDHGSERLVRVPVVSRQSPPEGGLEGRIPTHIVSGALERRAGANLSVQESHVLLCGNPAMIKDATAALGERGLSKHRVRKPGNISFEKYW